MKNYELITILSELPAGAEVNFHSSAWEDTNEIASILDTILPGDIDYDDGKITISVAAIDLPVPVRAIEDDKPAIIAALGFPTEEAAS